MEREKYGDCYQTHLLEQYKLYVEMADRISARRGLTNSFYITLLSSLLAVLAISGEKQIVVGGQGKFLLLIVSIIGLALCVVWLFNIRSFMQLNSAKFKVIHEIEEFLPFACYDREWEIAQKGRGNKYLRQTRVEQYIPFILAIPYFMLFCYAVVSILSK